MPPDLRTLSDNELVDRILQGDTAAFGPLVDRNIKQVIGFLRYLRTPEMVIDDLAQETFVKAFRNIRQFDRARPFFKWLLAIARNTLFDEKRRYSRELAKVRKVGESTTESTPGVEGEVIRKQTVQDLIATLDERDRFLIEARIFKDLSFQEIAELTGDQPGTLMVRFHRVIKRFRASMEEKQA